MMICKMSLNLSRGKPLKYASSNRIASYVGNGILTFIDERTKYEDFFCKMKCYFTRMKKTYQIKSMILKMILIELTKSQQTEKKDTLKYLII